MSDLGQINLHWSHLLIQALVAHGIRHFVLSPGSRSTPLALAVARTPGALYEVIIDERSAAFFALGQSKQQRSASALICTSGSAVANWMPAVVEANHGAVPLLLLSADRPPELHGRGANQTIEQSSLFGAQLRAAHALPPPDEIDDAAAMVHSLVTEVMSQLQQPIPGPVQLNIPFREPLLPQPLESFDWQPLPFTPTPPIQQQADLPPLSALIDTVQRAEGILLCGAAHYSEPFYTQLVELVERLDCVALIDPLSNLRWGHPPHPRLLTHYDATLRHSIADLRPEWALQLGDFPLSKSVAQWLQQHPPETYITVQHQRLWSDPESLSTQTIHCPAEQLCEALLDAVTAPVQPPSTENPLLEREQQAAAWESRSEALNEQQLLQQLHRALPSGTQLFSANSMMIRDIDGWLGAREAPLTLHANRGCSGIDGNLSTVCGIRTTTPKDVPVVALLGDLTLFHDLNALSIVKQISGNLTLFVVNNGGGNIFSYLPPAGLPEFEKIWLTPPQIDFEQAAALYQIDYLRIDTAVDLQQQLPTLFQQQQPKLVELVIDRSASIEAHRHYWESLQ